jgi:hypothetical protein
LASSKGYGKARLSVLDDKKAKQAVIDDLAQLHAIGQQNFAGRVTSDDDMEKWTKAVNEWCQSVSDFLKEKVSVAQQLSFDHTQQTLALSWNHKFNDSHDKMLSQVRARVDRLQFILDELQFSGSFERGPRRAEWTKQAPTRAVP